MSDTESGPNEGTETVSIESVEQAVESYRSQTKRREYELPDPDGDGVLELWFEYRMLSEAEREEMANKSTSFTPTRSGQDDEMDINAAEGRLYAIKTAVVDTNIEGFKATDRGVKQATTPDIREDLGDAIADFSEMPEREKRKFR